ncbi:MAG: hypothetical protein QNJ05_15420 [Woeseiaceae bacterium]|nr:hypothetical protein [Woeseiaceae bacterium]
MSQRIKKPFFPAAAMLLTLASSLCLAELPEGYWSAEQAGEVLEKTLTVELEPALDELTDAERAAVPHLLDAGRVMHELYLRQKHPESISARDALLALDEASDDGQRTRSLLELFYLFKGPVATTLDNQRQSFVPATDEAPGKALYPSNASREFIESLVAGRARSNDSIFDERSVVKAVTAESIAEDLEQLDRFPGVAALNPGLKDRLESLDATPGGLYAVPYALAYAPELARVRESLYTAAGLLEAQTPDFAAYLRQRARDLLSGDYEGGDAAWVSGDFDGLNLQIGSYETYDDALFGVKAFYGASLLARDVEKSDALADAIEGLQAMQDSLPHDQQKTVRAALPVGVYNVVADFGQARGANTATILPNDADHTRKYGRTILIRNNILMDPALFAVSKKRFDGVVAAEFRDDLTLSSGFDRTLWHEIGHYLGVDKTADGRRLSDALRDRSDLIEELKADLISLFLARRLSESGYYDQRGLEAHYASGVLRTLQRARPRPSQPYQNMQLMQFNYFIETGVIEPDFETGLLRINYDRYHQMVAEFLEQVLHIQFDGDYAAADAFVTRWNYWEDKLHGRLAETINASSDYRYSMVRYGILQSPE